MTLTVVAVIFGIFGISLILLLIYKSTLTMHRDDQLFLDDASSHMHEEQTDLLAKVSRITIPVRVFSMGSGVFFLALVATFEAKIRASGVAMGGPASTPAKANEMIARGYRFLGVGVDGLLLQRAIAATLEGVNRG